MNDNNSGGSGTGAAEDAASDRVAGDQVASGRAEAARAAKAEEKAAKRGAQKEAQKAAAAERAEKKAAKKAKRAAEIAQKKAQKEAAQESDEDASGAADGQLEEAAPLAARGETKETDALPAKVVKEKKPKKSSQTKSSRPKEIRRAIRPIRSKSQQTTARLIWAVFGMALVIVAIAGFWFVLNSQEDTTEIDVLVVAAERLAPGNPLELGDVIPETIDLKEESTLSYVPASEQNLYGRVILEEASKGELLTFSMLGDTPPGGEEEFDSQNEIEFQIVFPGPVTFPEAGVSDGTDADVSDGTPAGLSDGTRVVIYVIQAESDSKFAFEVVDIARGSANEIYLRGSYEDRAWWEKNFTQAYSNQESGVSFELEIPMPVDPAIDTLCWRERFRTIYGVGALPSEQYRELITALECPESFLDSLPEGPSSPESETPSAESETPGAEEGGTESDVSVAERLERERFSADRPVPDELSVPADPSDGESGALPEELDFLIAPPTFPDQ